MARKAHAEEAQWILEQPWQVFIRGHFAGPVGLTRATRIWQRFTRRVDRIPAFRHMISWAVIGRRWDHQPNHLHGFLGNVGRIPLAMAVLSREWSHVTEVETSGWIRHGSFWWDEFDSTRGVEAVRYIQDHDPEGIQLHLSPGLKRRNREYVKSIELGRRIIARAAGGGSPTRLPLVCGAQGGVDVPAPPTTEGAQHRR